MTTTSTTATPSADTAAPICCPDALDALKEAFREFFHDPQSGSAWSELTRAVQSLSPADAEFPRSLDLARRELSAKHGGYSQRFVLSKDVGPDGSLRPLPRAIPVRDDTRKKLSRLVRNNPDRFPGGIQQLLDDQRPLQQAKTDDFAKLVAATIRLELGSLLRCDRKKLLKSAATLLDLAEAFRHMRHVGQAHPKVIETIDRRDATAMIEFLVTVGTRTPLTEEELLRIVPIAARGWTDVGDRDQIVRGRILQTGLDGKSTLLKSWVEPFAAEIVFSGLMSKLQLAFRKRLSESASSAAPAARPTPAPPPRKSDRPTTTGTFSAPLRTARESAAATSVPSAPPPAPTLSDTAPVDVSVTDAFKIPIGVPEPPKLQVLRNYLRVSGSTTSMRLTEAMRLAEARDDVAGHRQYVQQVFHEARWAITGQTRGDPIFSPMPHAKSNSASEG